ncbi:MAG: ABC transporter ATP-binding protein [Mycobacteriales bacterium]
MTLEVAAGQLCVLVGPSGAGKTTLLRAIAGLEDVVAGRLELGGRSLLGLPPQRRRVALVFQEPRLFPNLDAADNVAFGLRVAGGARGDRRLRAEELLDEVGLAGFAARRVRGLSGGEQSRVALARSLCLDPDLLLLDEPLAALDPHRREGIRRLIHRLQRQRCLTTLYVTHDRVEAAELGDEVAFLVEGRLVQCDRPEAIFARPRSAAVARFFGSTNLMTGPVTAGRLPLADAQIAVPGADGAATFTIRPERVRLHAEGPLRLRVREASYVGTHVRLELRSGDLTIEAHVAPELAPPPGASVRVDLPREHLWRLPDAGLPDVTADPVPTPLR